MLMVSAPFVERVSERGRVDAVVLERVRLGFADARFDPVVFARARLALSALERLPIRLRVDKCGAMENTRSSSSRASAGVRRWSSDCEVSCEWEVSWEEWVLGSESVERRGSAAVEVGREAAVEEGRSAVEEGRSAVEEGREVVC